MFEVCSNKWFCVRFMFVCFFGVIWKRSYVLKCVYVVGLGMLRSGVLVFFVRFFFRFLRFFVIVVIVGFWRGDVVGETVVVVVGE